MNGPARAELASARAFLDAADRVIDRNPDAARDALLSAKRSVDRATAAIDRAKGGPLCS